MPSAAKDLHPESNIDDLRQAIREEVERKLTAEILPFPKIDPDGLYRVRQICKSNKDDADYILPISPNTWWKGVRERIYPPGQKLSVRVTVWLGSDLLAVKNGTWRPNCEK